MYDTLNPGWWHQLSFLVTVWQPLHMYSYLTYIYHRHTLGVGTCKFFMKVGCQIHGDKTCRSYKLSCPLNDNTESNLCAGGLDSDHLCPIDYRTELRQAKARVDRPAIRAILDEFGYSIDLLLHALESHLRETGVQPNFNWLMCSPIQSH